MDLQEKLQKGAIYVGALAIACHACYVMSLHDNAPKFSFTPHYQVVNAPIEFVWDHASPRYLHMDKVELPHRGHPGIVSGTTTPTFPRAGSRAEYVLTDGSKALEVVDDRNDVGHVFRYSVYQTGFLGLFIFKLQGIWKFTKLDSARTKWTFRFRLVPKNRAGNLVAAALMNTWKGYQHEMIPDIRHQLQDMWNAYVESGNDVPPWTTTVENIDVDYPLHNNHF